MGVAVPAYPATFQLKGHCNGVVSVGPHAHVARDAVADLLF